MCFYPFALILLSPNPIDIHFKCNFTEIIHFKGKWTELKAPFFLLDHGFEPIVDLLDVYHMDSDCIALWNPFGFESQVRDTTNWIKVPQFSWSGAILIKSNNYSSCLYPEVSRVTYNRHVLSEKQLFYFQSIGNPTLKLPMDSTALVTTSKMGNILIHDKIPSSLHIVKESPSPLIDVAKKSVTIEIYPFIGLLCNDCNDIYSLEVFLYQLQVSIFSFDVAIPSKQRFLENYFLQGYLRLPYGIYTLYILPLHHQLSFKPTSPHIPQFKYHLIQPKTTCSDYCQSIDSDCNPFALGILNNCSLLKSIFNCHYCYKGRRLIFYFKSNTCEIASKSSLSCTSSGFGTIPCVCY